MRWGQGTPTATQKCGSSDQSADPQKPLLKRGGGRRPELGTRPWVQKAGRAEIGCIFWQHACELCAGHRSQRLGNGTVSLMMASSPNNCSSLYSHADKNVAPRHKLPVSKRTRYLRRWACPGALPAGCGTAQPRSLLMRRCFWPFGHSVPWRLLSWSWDMLHI